MKTEYRIIHAWLPAKFFGAIAFSAAVLLLPACNQPEPPQVEGEAGYEQNVAEESETLEQAIENPSEYVGQTLTVNGEVEEVFSEDAFRLREEEYFAPDPGLLIINPNPDTPLPDVGEYIEVTGEIQTFLVGVIEEDYELTWDANLVRELEAIYQEKPAMIADTIDLTPPE
ncbi:MAG TPA: hypothetical protein ACFE0H_11125 [Elainellaceae cyanobacterium]